MKHLLFFTCLSLLAFAKPAQATQRPLAPTDTLPGHARLVRIISTSLCTQLTDDHATDIAKLSSADAMAYTQRLFIKAMQSDSVRLLAMMATAAERDMQPAQVGQLLGHDAMVELTQTCPASKALMIRLSQTEQGQQAMASQMPKLSPAEQKVLQPVTAALCTELSARNAQTPFSQLTPTGRQQAFMAALQKAYKPHMAALTRYYGAAALAAKLRNGELDGKVSSLMPGIAGCGQYLVLIGADHMNAPAQKP